MDQLRNICCGYLLNGKSRFCLRKPSAGQNYCGTLKHKTEKHLLQLNTFYIVKNSTSAFCQPCLSTVGMDEDTILRIQSSSKSLSDWNKVFTVLSTTPNLATPADKKVAARKLESVVSKFPLATPAKVKLSTVSEDNVNEDDADENLSEEPLAFDNPLPERYQMKLYSHGTRYLKTLNNSSQPCSWL